MSEESCKNCGREGCASAGTESRMEVCSGILWKPLPKAKKNILSDAVKVSFGKKGMALLKIGFTDGPIVSFSSFSAQMPEEVVDLILAWRDKDAAPEKTCVWTRQDGSAGFYVAACREERSVSAYDYVFCPYCSGRIVRKELEHE